MIPASCPSWPVRPPPSSREDNVTKKILTTLQKQTSLSDMEVGEMAERLVLYGMGSPNVMKVILMLEELGLAYELRHVAVFRGEQLTPEFLARNPLGKVPVLEDPMLGKPLAESGAILIWLAERTGRLLPSQQPARSEVLQWVMMQMSSVGPMLGQFGHFNLLPKITAPYALGRFRVIAERLYRLLDMRLQTRDWMAGDAYSIADIAIQPWASYLDSYHGYEAGTWPSLFRWRERIADRPAYARAVTRADEAFCEATERAIEEATCDDLDRFFGRTSEVPPVDYSAVKQMKAVE